MTETDDHWSDEDEIDRLNAYLAALVAGLPRCFACAEPATKAWFSLLSCDQHVGQHKRQQDAEKYDDLPYAQVLRSLMGRP